MENDTHLTKSLRSLEDTIERSNSLSWIFLKGIVSGIGAVIGASVLAGLLLSWLATTFDHARDIPLIGPFFSDLSQTLETAEGVQQSD